MTLELTTLACAVACLVLVAAEYRQARTLRAVSKTLASLLFITVGVLAVTVACASPEPAFGAFQRWIVIGLVLGAVGDVALLGSSEKAFLGGLGAFLLGHVAYVVAVAQLVAPTEWLAATRVYALVPTSIGGVALGWLWRHLGSMKGPVIAYVVVIVAMVVGALAALLIDVHDANRQLFALGAILFFASDLAVARDRFVAAGFTNRVWGLPCYYAGQLLIAWSLLPRPCL